MLHSDVTKRRVTAAASRWQPAGQPRAGRRPRSIKIADGARVVVIDNLSKPDGMVAAQGGWVFSQEGGAAPVSLARDGKVTRLFEGDSARVERRQAPYAIEDRKGNGRLMRYDWQSGQLDVLRSGLTETEGLTRCRGDLLYTEKPGHRAPWPPMATTGGGRRFAQPHVPVL